MPARLHDELGVNGLQAVEQLLQVSRKRLHT